MTKKILCFFIAIILLIGTIPFCVNASDGSVDIVSGDDTDAYAKDAPISTIRLDWSKINKDNVVLEQEEGLQGYIYKINDEGFVYLENAIVNNGVKSYHPFTIKYPDAALMADGSRKPLVITFYDVRVMGKETAAPEGYTDTLFFANTNPYVKNVSVSFSPISTQQRHVGMQSKVLVYVEGADTGDTLMITPRGINVSRAGNSSFSQITYAHLFHNYSESFELGDGIADGSAVYLPSDSIMDRVGVSIPDGSTYRFVGTSRSVDALRQDAFTTVIDANSGFNATVRSSAGVNTIPIEMYILSANKSYALSTAAGENGTITLWADGTLNSTSAPALAGGTTEAPLSYCVPEGKEVSVCITPDEGYMLDTLTVNGQAADPDSTRYAADGETIEYYALNLPAAQEDIEVEATFKQIPHVHRFNYTADNDNFRITATCTKKFCPLTDSQIILQASLPAHKAYGDGLDANAGLTGKQELIEATGGAAEVRVVYEDEAHISSGEIAPTGVGNYTVTLSILDNGQITKAEKDYSIVKGNVTPVIVMSDWTYGEAAVTPSLEESSKPAGASVTYYYKPFDAQESAYTTDVPSNAGKYTLKAVTEETLNYNQGTATCTFEIKKAVPTPEIPAHITAVYGDTLADISLPQGWAWADDTQSVGAAGTKTFSAVFTQEPVENYESVTADIPVDVAKKPVTVTIEDKTSYCGSALETLSFTMDEGALLPGDELGITLSTDADSAVAGSYNITLSWNQNENYALTVIGGMYTVSPAPVYSFEDGTSLAWHQGSGADLDFTVHRDTDDSQTFGNFTELRIDDTVVDPTNYNADEGSLHITLKADFLDTLSLGEHTMSVHFNDGEAQSSLRILEAEQEPTPTPDADDAAADDSTPPADTAESTATPSTGDELPAAILCAAALAATAATLTVIKRKKDA